MKKILIINTLAILIALITLFSSFVGIRQAAENPGTITFTTNAGSESTFTVGNWKFNQCYIKAEDIENLVVEAEMDMSSLDCSWKELETSVKKKKDYFYIKKFPTATLSIKGAKKAAANEYVCDAILTLRKIAHPIKLTFMTTKSDKGLVIKGSGIVNRRNHSFTGDGPKDEVPVNFEFLAK